MLVSWDGSGESQRLLAVEKVLCLRKDGGS
jgi:hypothetical protein